MEEQIVAELRSFDGYYRLRLTFLGYQYPEASEGHDANWYRLQAEVETHRTYYRLKTCALDAKNLATCVAIAGSLQTYLEEERSLLWTPYRNDLEIKLKTKRARLRPRTRGGFPKFRSALDGLHISGKVGDLHFEFKVQRTDLKKFTDALKQASEMYPERFHRRPVELNPVRLLESRFRGHLRARVIEGWRK